MAQGQGINKYLIGMWKKHDCKNLDCQHFFTLRNANEIIENSKKVK